MVAIVVLDLASSVVAKRLAGQSVSEMAYFVYWEEEFAYYYYYYYYYYYETSKIIVS